VARDGKESSIKTFFCRKKAQDPQKRRTALITSDGFIILLVKSQHGLRLMSFPFAYFVLFCGK
jgi:hypothetical protein